MSENKMEKKNKISLIIISLIVLFGVFVSTSTIGVGSIFFFPAILNLIIYVALLVYAFVSFKKPHNHLLKWVIMLFAFSIILYAVTTEELGDVFSLLMGINALLCAYMSGRLHDLKKNKRLIAIIIIIFIINIIVIETNQAFVAIIEIQEASLSRFVCKMLPLSTLIQFIAIVYAYIFRYKSHEEAGRKADEELEAKCEKY